LKEPPDLPRDQTIVLVARTDRRARRAAYLLKQYDFQQLVLLSGGMQAWESADMLTAVDLFAPQMEGE